MENNSHCVRNEVEMKLIEDMLSAIAAHQFQKEKWFHFDFWSKFDDTKTGPLFDLWCLVKNR